MNPEYYKGKGYCTNCDYKGDIEIRIGKKVPREGVLGGLFGTYYSQWPQGSPVQCPNCGNYSCYASR